MTKITEQDAYDILLVPGGRGTRNDIDNPVPDRLAEAGCGKGRNRRQRVHRIGAAGQSGPAGRQGGDHEQAGLRLGRLSRSQN